MSRLRRLLHIPRSALWLFLCGAVIGSALDTLHVYSRIERYAAPVLFGLAWWVPLLFGSAAVAIDVPYWLPCIYACASLTVGDLGRSLLQREDYHARRTRPPLEY